MTGVASKAGSIMVAQRCAAFGGSSFKGRTSTAAALELVYYASAPWVLFASALQKDVLFLPL